MVQEQDNGGLSAEGENSIREISLIMGKVRESYTGSQAETHISSLALDTQAANRFSAAMVTLFAEVDVSYALVESGIPMANSFGGEMLRIIKSNILPYVYDERDLRVVVKKIFHQKKDAAIFSELIDTHGADWICANAPLLLPDRGFIQTCLENAAKIISYRIAATGMEEEIATRAGKNESLITPFVEQNREINELLVSLEAGDRTKAAEDYAQAVIMLRQCQDNIRDLDKAAAENGTSLTQTYLLRRASLLIERLMAILALLMEIEEEGKIQGFCTLICDIIRYELSPRKLRTFLSSNVQMIAYRITEHKRMTGEHYITAGRSEYFDMFLSACGGGLIVSLMVIVKLFLHHLGLPPLWEGLAYSLNYAIGFVVVQMLHFTIATKQPAMTAAYIAASLDSTDTGVGHYRRFASMIAAVSRSQLVSFAGNLLIVFPCSLLWITLISVLGGDYLIEPPAAEKILQDVSPIFSLSVLYAGFAGAYLFLAGLISGFGDNKVIVSHIGLRLIHHPWLSRHMSPDRLKYISTYIEHNLGGLMGNIAVGFMLGMTAFFGHITGLPLDIRHITFSAGNFALGLFGTHFHVTVMTVLSCLSGLMLIGLVNFVVSFWLALFVAMRSRGLYLRNYPDLLRSVLRYFWSHPTEFLWPGKAEVIDAAIIAKVEGE